MNFSSVNFDIGSHVKRALEDAFCRIILNHRGSKWQSLFAISLIMTWRLKKMSQQNKETMILGVETPTTHKHSGFRKISSKAWKDTHWLMSRVDYGFDQWSVVIFIIKKLYVYLFIVKQCIYLVTLMYFMQIYFQLSWAGNKFTDFVVFLNSLLPYTQREL